MFYLKTVNSFRSEMSKFLEIIAIVVLFQCTEISEGFVFLPEIEYKKDTHFSFKPIYKPFEIFKGIVLFPFVKPGEHHVPVPEKHKRSADVPFTFKRSSNNIQLLSRDLKNSLKNDFRRRRRETMPIPGPPNPIDVIKPPALPPTELGVLPPKVVNIPVNPAVTHIPGFLIPEQTINGIPIGPLFTDITGRLPFPTIPPLNLPPPNVSPPAPLPPVIGNNIESEKPKEEKPPVPDEPINPLARGSRLAMYFGSVILDLLTQLVTNARSAFIQYSESPPKI